MAFGTCPKCKLLVTPREIRDAACPHCKTALSDAECGRYTHDAARTAVLYNLPRNHKLALPPRRLAF